ncbi:MAG: NUDIX hydrolase [Acidiferrobacterales bacterium]
MKYCSECGAEVTLEIPSGDNRPRYICSQCETIHYSNPKIVAGCIPVWQDKILLCKRAIEPQHGLWTLPAGFMENDESTVEAAMRETMEEAGANVEVRDLYTMISLVHINQVYMMFLADMTNTEFAPGEESLEVDLFGESEIPWDQIAFPVIEETMRLFFADRASGNFRTRIGEMTVINREERQFSSRYLDKET